MIDISSASSSSESDIGGGGHSSDEEVVRPPPARGGSDVKMASVPVAAAPVSEVAEVEEEWDFGDVAQTLDAHFMQQEQVARAALSAQGASATPR